MPFNIGERVYLRDFSREEVLRFAPALGGKGATLVDRIHYWTNGHPFLTQSLCAACAADTEIQTPAQVDALVEKNLFGPKARDRNINLADVANRALNSGASEADPERFRADAEVLDGVGLAGNGADIAAMLWARPALTVLGIDAPSVSGSAMAIPATARARLSLRLPPTPGKSEDAKDRNRHVLVIGNSVAAASISSCAGRFRVWPQGAS